MPKLVHAAATLHQDWLVRLHSHVDTTREPTDESSAVNASLLLELRRLQQRLHFRSGHGVLFSRSIHGNQSCQTCCLHLSGGITLVKTGQPFGVSPPHFAGENRKEIP